MGVTRRVSQTTNPSLVASFGSFDMGSNSHTWKSVLTSSTISLLPLITYDGSGSKTPSIPPPWTPEYPLSAQPAAAISATIWHWSNKSVPCLLEGLMHKLSDETGQNSENGEKAESN
jgi:hypothetical protein